MIFALIPLVMASFVISFHDWDGIADTMKFVGVSKTMCIQVMVPSEFPESTGQPLIYSIMPFR